MYQLCQAKKDDVRAAKLGRIDEELVVQCAYYPRPAAFGGVSPCEACSFDRPRRSCKWGHILNDTRIGREVWTNNKSRGKAQVRGKEDIAKELGFFSFERMMEELREWRNNR